MDSHRNFTGLFVIDEQRSIILFKYRAPSLLLSSALARAALLLHRPVHRLPSAGEERSLLSVNHYNRDVVTGQSLE